MTGTAEATGTTIIAAMRALRVPAGAAAVWFFGQASVAVKTAQATIYIDPYFSDYVERVTGAAGEPIVRRFPSLIDPRAVSNADLVLITHDHGDHLDLDTLPALAAASPRARFVLPGRSAKMLAAAGVPVARLETPGAWAPVSPITGLSITAVPAAHETFEEDPELGHRFFGYVIDAGVRLYHSGDTVPYAGLAERLHDLRVHVGMVAINGRDVFRRQRGIIGNMDAREAAELAGRAGFDVTIPLHYDLFDANGEDPGRFVDHLYRRYPGRSALVLGRGACILYAAPGYTASGA